MDCIENYAPNNYSVVAIVFVAALKLLLSRCLATTGDKHTEKQNMGGIYDVRR
jgi:hypothetical protein